MCYVTNSYWNQYPNDLLERLFWKGQFGKAVLKRMFWKWCFLKVVFKMLFSKGAFFNHLTLSIASIDFSVLLIKVVLTSGNVMSQNFHCCLVLWHTTECLSPSFNISDLAIGINITFNNNNLVKLTILNLSYLYFSLLWFWIQSETKL